MAEYMEVILLFVMIAGFIANFFAMRYFFRQIFRKINFMETVDNPITTMGTAGSIPTGNPLFSKAPDEPAPLPNDVPENDPNEMEFNEQTFGSLPPDLKVEVEGGDTSTPPGFEEKNT